MNFKYTECTSRFVVLTSFLPKYSYPESKSLLVEGMRDHSKSSLRAAFNRFRNSLVKLREGVQNCSQREFKKGFKEKSKPEQEDISKKMFELIFEVVQSREKLERILAAEMCSLVAQREIDKADKELIRLQWTYNFVDIRQLQAMSHCEKMAWWWHRPNHFLDEWDSVFKFFTVGFLTIFVAILFDIVPRFWIGGPSLVGILAVVGPAILTWILGKEPLENLAKVLTSVESDFKRRKYIGLWVQELICIISFLLMGFTYHIHAYALPSISKCYYNNAVRFIPEIEKDLESHDKKGVEIKNIFLGSLNSLTCNIVLFSMPTPSKDIRGELQSMSKAESALQRAAAFNPDDAEVHFALGWIHENREDKELAKKSYGLAFQNGSFLAGIRLAGIYLGEEKKSSTNSALIVLNKLRENNDIEDNSNKPDSFFYKRSWSVLMAEVRLSQNRYIEAYEVISDALDREINSFKQPKILAESASNVTSLYCSAALTYEYLNNSKLYTSNASILRAREMASSIEGKIRKINDTTQLTDGKTGAIVWLYAKESVRISMEIDPISTERRNYINNIDDNYVIDIDLDQCIGTIKKR
jgi:hypothetical protein